MILRERIKTLKQSFQTENISPPYAYIKTKAQIYMRRGVERYRKGDSLGMPDITWEDDCLAAIERGMNQILQGLGSSPDRPLTGIGIGGFYALIQTLHFQVKSQLAMPQEEGGFLDEMQLEHCMTGQSLILYNRVLRSNDEYEDCPELFDDETPSDSGGNHLCGT